MKRKFKALISLCLLSALSAGGANAAVIPAGLNPGDTFQYVFVTSSFRDAASPDIADYNSFVTSVAASGSETAGLGDWYAIGSTAAIDARDNINPGGIQEESTFRGFFRVDGVKIADGASALWDGSIDNPINVDENGLSVGLRVVLTGTDADGSNGDGMWCLDCDIGNILAGLTGKTTSDWIVYRGVDGMNVESFYAASSAMAVATVTAPSAAFLCLPIALGLAVVRRRKLRSR